MCKLANYLLNEKRSLFDYFWNGFNTSLISIGEDGNFFQKQDGLVWLAIDKLFDYLSFYNGSFYSVGISGFAIYKDLKQIDRFCDLLNHFAEKPSQKGDIINFEVKNKEQAVEIIKEIYKESSKLETKGNLFIRIMIYNTKTRLLSNLHLVNTMCNPETQVELVIKLIYYRDTKRL